MDDPQRRPRDPESRSRATMASHQEIEVKLRTDPEQIAKLRRSRWWREVGPVRRQSLHSIYFDTDDRHLRDCNISLLTRTDGHAIVQTARMMNSAPSPARRPECRSLGSAPIPAPSMVLS